MIIPRVQSTCADEVSLVASLKSWGFLGSVLLHVDDHPDFKIESVVKKVSGFCDLLIRFDSAPDELAIELLNIGASHLVVGSAWALADGDLRSAGYRAGLGVFESREPSPCDFNTAGNLLVTFAR